MKNLQDKVIIVTGGGGGVGRELCKQFAAKGANLIVADVNAQAIEASLQAIKGNRHAGTGVTLDVSSKDSWEALLQKVQTEFGRCDVLCNNAAVLRTGTLQESPLDHWYLQSKVNIDGVVLGCKTFSPMMTAQGEGHIVNVSSLGGMIGLPGWTYYTASKFAVVGFSQCLAAELAEAGVYVSVVCPGGIDTHMNDDLTVDMGDEPLLPPAKVAEYIVNEVQSEKPRQHVFTHMEYREMLSQHFQGILAEYAHLS